MITVETNRKEKALPPGREQGLVVIDRLTFRYSAAVIFIFAGCARSLHLIDVVLPTTFWSRFSLAGIYRLVSKMGNERRFRANTQNIRSVITLQ